MKYRKTYLVDALQFTGDNIDEILNFSQVESFELGKESHYLKFKNSEYFLLYDGDWILRSVNDSVYSIGDETFKATYEAVE